MNEQQIARALLTQRDEGFSIWKGIRSSSLRCGLRAVTAAVFLVGAVFVSNLPIRLAFTWGFGFLLGSLSRDVMWLRHLRNRWPFACRITDWAKVEAIANGGEQPLVQEAKGDNDNKHIV